MAFQPDGRIREVDNPGIGAAGDVRLTFAKRGSTVAVASQDAAAVTDFHSAIAFKR